MRTVALIFSSVLLASAAFADTKSEIVQMNDVFNKLYAAHDFKGLRQC